MFSSPPGKTNLNGFTSAEKQQYSDSETILRSETAEALALAVQIKALQYKLHELESSTAQRQTRLDKLRYQCDSTCQDLEKFLLKKTSTDVVKCSFDRLNNDIFIDIPNEKDHDFLSIMLRPFLSSREFRVIDGPTSFHGEPSIRAVVSRDKVDTLLSGLSLAADEVNKKETVFAKC